MYRNYVNKAIDTEGKALVSAIKNAEAIYYAEHGTWYLMGDGSYGDSYDPVLGIDARGNKYFKGFKVGYFSGASSPGMSATTSYKNIRISAVWRTDPNVPFSLQGHQAPFMVKSDDSYATYEVYSS